MRNIEQASRAALLAQFPAVQTSKVVNATTPNTAVIEVPYVGRYFGAIQVYDPTGGAWTATFVVEGALADPLMSDQGFVTALANADYVAIGSAITAPGIVQLPFGSTWGRIRVRCTSYGSGNPVVKVL